QQPPPPVREPPRVQTFPDWFRFAGQPSLRLKQIGNAVPPLLGEALGRQLRSGLKTRTIGRAGDGTQCRELRVGPLRSGVKRRTIGGASDGTHFRDLLIAWHVSHRRDYPWRGGTSD